MRFPLPYLNLCGVFVLAILCVFQWRANRSLHLASHQLESVCRAQTTQIQELDRSVSQSNADLERVREQLTRVTDRLTQTGTTLATTQLELVHAASERDELRVQITNWIAAVAARDAQLADASDHLKRLGDDRNEAVLKFNDLVAKHDEVINLLNERTREFNELVERYNRLARSGRAPAP